MVWDDRLGNGVKAKFPSEVWFAILYRNLLIMTKLEKSVSCEHVPMNRHHSERRSHSREERKGLNNPCKPPNPCSTPSCSSLLLFAHLWLSLLCDRKCLTEQIRVRGELLWFRVLESPVHPVQKVRLRSRWWGFVVEDFTWCRMIKQKHTFPYTSSHSSLLW